MFRPLALLVSGLLLVAVAAVPARADHGGDGGDVRVAGTCGKGATSKLRLKSEDNRIEVRFEIEHIRFAGRWRVTVVQEGRVAYRGSYRARRSFEIRRRLHDLSGADRVSVRALGPRGLTCSAGATLPG